MRLDQDQVPASFDEALALLSSALTKAEKEAWTAITAAKLFELQAKLAKVLRQDWSIDEPGTPLRLFFRELGLDDPEQISLLLLDAFWRAHNHEAIPVHQLVEEYLEE
jgi:hypothetical protein